MHCSRRNQHSSGGLQKVELHMNGRKVAELVSNHMARMMEHVQGPATFDGTLSLAPVEMNI